MPKSTLPTSGFSSGGPNWKSTHWMSMPRGLKVSSSVWRWRTAGRIAFVGTDANNLGPVFRVQW